MRALVLSGAGAGLFAHGGAMRALAERGIFRFDYVTGASAGAIAAALYCAGRDHVIADLAGELDSRALWGDGRASTLRRAIRLISEMAWLDSTNLRALLDCELPDSAVREMARSGPVCEIPAFDVSASELIWVGPGVGPTAFRTAILGSAALPGALPPVAYRDELGRERLLVDGGVAANHPIERAAHRVRAAGGGEVIVFSALQRADTGPLRGIIDLAGRVVTAFLDRAARADREAAEQLGVRIQWISLAPLSISLTSFTRDDALAAFDAGYASAMRAL